MKLIENVTSAEKPAQITRYGMDGRDFNFDIRFDGENKVYVFKTMRFEKEADLKIWLCDQKIEALSELVL